MPHVQPEPLNIKTITDADANGFGIGSVLYKPGKPLGETSASARDFVTAWRKLAE